MNDGTELLRQVHPSFVQNGRATSQTFHPTPKDESKLSVYDGDQIDPASAHAHFVSQPNCRSIGVLAVTVAECYREELPVTPDPEPYPEHVIIDFSAFGTSARKTKAKQLLKAARERGWRFQAAS